MTFWRPCASSAAVKPKEMRKKYSSRSNITRTEEYVIVGEQSSFCCWSLQLPLPWQLFCVLSDPFDAGGWCFPRRWNQNIILSSCESGQDTRTPSDVEVECHSSFSGPFVGPFNRWTVSLSLGQSSLQHSLKFDTWLFARKTLPIWLCNTSTLQIALTYSRSGMSKLRSRTQKLSSSCNLCFCSFMCQETAPYCVH